MITIQIPDRLKHVVGSVIFAKLIPLGSPRCNCNQTVFPRNCYISRKSIRLGIKNVIVIVIFRKLIPKKTTIVVCNHFDDEGVPGLSRHFPEMSAKFVYVFPFFFLFFHWKTGKHITNLTPTHFQDDPEKLFMFIVFLP